MKVNELKSLTNGLKKRETYVVLEFLRRKDPTVKKKFGVERREGCFFSHNFCEKETSFAPSETVRLTRTVRLYNIFNNKFLLK